ncbi:MAG TPA: N-acyl homoserine lactonase family protein [Bryobacteraceae bacterium]|nr:N-acyl homoserine lactonase family protein [Bryobacteraceae bacterium]
MACKTVSLIAAFLLALPVFAQNKPKAPKSVRLYVFDGGTLDIPDTSPYRLKPEELATKNMSVACFLVVHPKGTLMWDACAVPDGASKIRYASTTKALQSQLGEIGYKPSDINYFSLSHFHWDHVGNANLFAGSTWLVTKAEEDIMFMDPPSPRTEPQNFSALKNGKKIMLTKSQYDVFGDGTVVIMAAPGHSPGHQTLFLKLKKTGSVVLSGDLYHYPEERARNLVPMTEFNAEQTAQSRMTIEAFLKETGAQLWIQHDWTANAKLKKSPGYYE